MKKIVLRFGFAAGAILSALMLLTFPLHDRIGTAWAMVVGYTTMVASMVLVYFGVRRYRDTVAGGTVGFWRAFGVGMLIASIAGLCYVATWQVVYFTMAPDYLEKYNAQALAKERANGATEAELAARRAEMARFEELYRNPAFNAAVTFLEPLPVCLLASLVSAAALRRRRAPGQVVVPGAQAV
jgi:hypothetical protein